MQVNVHQAKTRLSELLVAAEAGEEVVIARSGTPIVRLVPITASAARRRPGFADGELRISDDFDETPDAFVQALERDGP